MFLDPQSSYFDNIMYPYDDKKNSMLLLDDNLIVPIKTIEELADQMLATEWGRGATITDTDIDTFRAALESKTIGVDDKAKRRQMRHVPPDSEPLQHKFNKHKFYKTTLKMKNRDVYVTLHGATTLKVYVDDIIRTLETVSKPPSYGNPFIARFGTGNIIVLRNPHKIYTMAEKRILERIKKSKDYTPECVLFKDQLTTKDVWKHKRVFKGVVPGLNFEIWQLKDDPKNKTQTVKDKEKDKFNPNNIHNALKLLTELPKDEKEYRNNKTTEQLATLLANKLKVTKYQKSPRPPTKKIMGCSAKEFARAMVGVDEQILDYIDKIHHLLKQKKKKN